MENFFMSEAQAAREEEEETARRRRAMLMPFVSGEASSPSTSAASLSSFGCLASTSSFSRALEGDSVGGTAEEATADSATAAAARDTAAAAAPASEGGGGDAAGGGAGATTGAEAAEVDPLDAYMSGITEQVKQQDEEARQRQQREAEEIAAAAAAAEEAAAAGRGAAGGTAISEQQQQRGVLRPPQQLLSGATPADTAGNAASFFSSSSRTNSSGGQRIFADDDDPLADSFEHVLLERKKAAEAQAARAAQGTRKRKADADFHSEEEDEEEEKLKSKHLPPVDHSKWIYPPFVKDIYKEFKQIGELTHAAVGELKRSLQLRTFGKNVPRPIASFLHLKDTFSSVLFTGLHKRGFSLPTPIQSAAIPCLLRGRDLLAVAETGSGKTAAYLIPLLARLQHLQEEQQWQRQQVLPAPEDTQSAAASGGDTCQDSNNKAATAGGGRGLLPHGGPAALVVCPTRELAVQLDGEVHALVSKSKKGAAALLLRRVLLAGGFDKTEQFKQLKQGVDLAICTPGRVIDTAATKGMQHFFQKVVAVVVDEADKLVDMGFEASLRTILNSVRRDRLTAMFSATFSPACESLARQFLDNPIKIIVGEQGQAAKSVEQHVVIVADEKKKFRWLADNILSLLARPPPHATAAEAAAPSGEDEQQQGRVAVIFCNTQQRCEDLAHLLEEELSQHVRRQHEQQQQQHASHGDDQAAAAASATNLDAVSAAAAAPSTRAAAARLLQLETDENPSALKRNPHQTFKYSAVVHGGLNLTERLAAIRRLHQHILHPPSESSSSGAAASSTSSSTWPAGAGAPPLLLIATDVASRGLDFPGALSVVISYDAPQEAEVYVHRIGRAGRAGRSGRSFALLTRAEKRAAAFIVESMRTVDQEPPRHVVDLAMLYPPFKTATLTGVKMQEPKRQGGKKGGRLPDNGLAGLGYSRDETGHSSSSSERRGGKSVASLVARAAAAAAEALKQQQQQAAAGGDSNAAADAQGAAARAEEGRGAVGSAAAGDGGSGAAGAADNNVQGQQRHQGGPKRGRWDSDEKKGSGTAGGNTLSGMRPPGSGSSSLLHSTDSTGINTVGSSSSTATTGKIVGIHDELSSDEDEEPSRTLLQQPHNPLQQQHFMQRQQQHFLPQQQQQHYLPSQLAYQHHIQQQPEPLQQPLDQQQLQQQLYIQEPYLQHQQYQQPPAQQQLQQHEDLQHQHKAEVDAVVQQAAAAAAAAARAAAAQIAAAKSSAYPAAYGSSTSLSMHTSRAPAPAVVAAGEHPYCGATTGAADHAAVAVAAGAGSAAACSAFEPAATTFAGGAAGCPPIASTPAGPAGGSSPPAPGSSAAGSAAVPKRASVLNLEKREQRRKQWLVHAEARREQLRLQNQRAEAAQKQQQQRYPSPVRKSFSERPHSVTTAARTPAGPPPPPPGGGGGRTGTAAENVSAGNIGRLQGA